MPVCTPPPGAHSDALCGVPLCGEAICGAFWIYVCPAGTGLGGVSPTVVLVSDEVPIAELYLGAYEPETIEVDALVAPLAGLFLGAEVPAYSISGILSMPAAGLGLGGDLPEFVGQTFLGVLVCEEIDLTTLACVGIDLAEAPALSDDLEPVDCR